MGFERFQFAQQRLDRVIEGFDNILCRFLAVQDVGRDAQGQRGGVQGLLRIPFQNDLQVNGIRREMLQMLFQLRDLLSKLFAEQEVPMKVLSDKIPRD